MHAREVGRERERERPKALSVQVSGKDSWQNPTNWDLSWNG